MNRDSDKRSPQKKWLNCWEVMMCGREPGGDNSAKYGVCPAAGTFCDGCVQGSFADKRPSCIDCDFYQMVQEEEGLANRQTKFLQFLAQALGVDVKATDDLDP